MHSEDGDDIVDVKGDPFGMRPCEWAGVIIIVLLIIFGVFVI